jgi:hypothetical protein
MEGEQRAERKEREDGRRLGVLNGHGDASRLRQLLHELGHMGGYVSKHEKRQEGTAVAVKQPTEQLADITIAV